MSGVKRRRGRPKKEAEAIGVEAWQVWTFLEERISAGAQMKAAVADAQKQFGISRAGVFRQLDMAETAGLLFALRAIASGEEPAEVFDALGMESLLQRVIS